MFQNDWVSLQLERNLPFLLCFTLYLMANLTYKPPGAYTWRGDIMEGFLLQVWGLIHGGASFRKFTVYAKEPKYNKTSLQ